MTRPMGPLKTVPPMDSAWSHPYLLDFATTPRERSDGIRSAVAVAASLTPRHGNVVPFSLTEDDLIVIAGLVLFVVVFLGLGILLVEVIVPRSKRLIVSVWKRPAVQKWLVCELVGHYFIVSARSHEDRWAAVFCTRCETLDMIPTSRLRFRVYVDPEEESAQELP